MATEESRKVRVGMVGGGPGAGIAETHRRAMRLDDRYELVAGVFSRDRDKTSAAARQLRIDAERVYSDYTTMATAEAKREDRIDAVVIVTPTASHYEIAKVFLEAGINVICDKPLCLSLAQARELKSLAEKGGMILRLTHNYSGYAMVRHAARMVRNGRLGEIRVVQAEHASGWAVSAAWPLWKEPCVPQPPAVSGQHSKAFEIRKATERRMRTIAVVGTGFIGSVHARNVARHPGARLVALYDANFESAKRIAGETGSQSVGDVGEIFDNRDIEAVVIATPTNTHVEYLQRAAQANKAIYCEKPIGLDYQEAEQAVRAVRAAGVPVMLGFNRRFDASHVAVKEAVDRGDVGKVEIVQLTTRGPKPPPISYVKVSGGQLRDQTVHFFDLLRWLTNDEPVEVYAIGAALVDPAIGEAGDVDTSIVSIRMASGALCQIDSSRRTAYGYDERVEVFGSDGMAESARQSFRGLSLYKERQILRDGLHPGWFERIEQSYYEAIDAFLKSLEKGMPPSPSLEDGLKAQLIADKATESMKTGQPIKIEK